MPTFESMRETYRTAVLRGAGYLIAARASWMTDEQWRQLDAFRCGREIPTDPEILHGLRYCTQDHSTHRVAGWAYSQVSSAIVNEPNFSWWCQFIREHIGDPDLAVDEGL